MNNDLRVRYDMMYVEYEWLGLYFMMCTWNVCASILSNSLKRANLKGCRVHCVSVFHLCSSGRILLLQDVYLYASYTYSLTVICSTGRCFCALILVCVCCDFTALRKIEIYAENVQIMAFTHSLHF